MASADLTVDRAGLSCGCWFMWERDFLGWRSRRNRICAGCGLPYNVGRSKAANGDGDSESEQARSLMVISAPRTPAERTGSCLKGRRAWTCSVVICAYTEERWSLLLRSVASAQEQTRLPLEVIVCIDHNEKLFERCRREWAATEGSSSVPVRVIANKSRGSAWFGQELRGRDCPRRHRGLLG